MTINSEIPATARAIADDVIGRSEWSAHVTKRDAADQPKMKDRSYVNEVRDKAEMRPLSKILATLPWGECFMEC